MLWHVLYLIPKGYALHHTKFSMLRFVTIALYIYSDSGRKNLDIYFTVILKHEK